VNNNQSRPAMDVQSSFKARSRNIVTANNKISVKYFECVSLFLPYLSGMKIAIFLRCILLLSASCPALPCFPTTCTILGKSYWIYNVCFDFFPHVFSEIFLILRRIQRDTVTHVHRTSCKGPVILHRFQSNFYSLDRLSKNTRKV
jgi:hypothetical protein